MKKRKNNVVSEEIISEEEIFDEDYSNDEYVETEISETKKKPPIGTILIIVILLAVVGVLGYFVFQKYNNQTPSSNVTVEEEPNAYVSVSTTPTITETVTPIPTEEPTTTPEPTEIPEEELEEETNNNDFLELEESDSNSLFLEEVEEDNEEINENYKNITVYYVESLKTFHTKDCAIIKDKDKIKTTAYSALKNDFEECSSCQPLKDNSLENLSEDDLKILEGITVYKTASNTKYHNENCSILKNTGIKISLKEAIENDLKACSLCNPKTLDNFKDNNSNSSSNGNSNSNKVTITSTPTPTSTSGKTTITPTPTKVATITATPTSIPVTSLSITGGNVYVGDTLQLYITYSPSNAVSKLTYTTSNVNVATISSSGIVTGVSTGTVTITISAPNGVSASSTVNVIAKPVTSTPTPTVTTTPTQTPTYTDTNLDINNLGLTGISKFVYPSNINLIDMEAMSDWQAFIYKISANGGKVTTTSSSITLSVGGVTRVQLVKYNDNIWSLRLYDSLSSTLNKCMLKAICTKISSMPDTIYSNIYDDYEVSEFIGERYRSIGDASIKSEISGDSVTYYIKDVNYEY